MKNVFSCRAELPEDVDQLDAAMAKLGCEYGRMWQPLLLDRGPDKEPVWMTDVSVEIHADISLEQLQDVIYGLDGCHYMLESLRQVPLKENSLERDGNIYTILENRKKK